MAIQNFLAGGFYGKLGDVVGQRWRNKRTLRRYVIGANPQTPAQQANRQQFADSVSLAQEAMNINKGSPAWVKVEASEFSLRIGTARRRIKNAVPSGQVIPIIPDDYQTFLTLSNLTLEQEAGELPSAIVSPSSIGADSRQFMFIIYVLDILGMIYKKIYLPATVAGVVPFSVPLSLPWEYVFTDESFIVGASSDDATNESKTIFIPSQTIAESGVPSRTIDLSFVSSSFTSAGLELIFEQNRDFEITADSFYANIVLNGALATLPVTDGAYFERINETQWKCTLSIPAANYWGADSKVLTKTVTEFFDPVDIMLKSAEITASNITPVIFLSLNSFTVVFYDSESPDRLNRSDITLNASRTFKIELYVYDFNEDEYTTIQMETTVPGSTAFSMPISMDWNQCLTPASYIKGATIDNVPNVNKTILIPQTTIAESGVPNRTIDLSFVSSSFTSAGLEILFKQNHDLEKEATDFYSNIVLNGALATLPVTDGAHFEKINDSQWKCTLSIPAANYWGANSKVLPETVTESFGPVDITFKSAEITASNITPVIFLSLNSFSVEFYYSESPDRLYRSDITLTASRTFKIELYVYDFNAEEYTTIQMETTVPGNTAFLMPISMDWNQCLTPASYIKGATIDNVPNVNKTILIPQTTISEPGGVFRTQNFSIVEYDLQSDSLYVLVEVPEEYSGTVPTFYTDVELYDGVNYEVFTELAEIVQLDEAQFEITVNFPAGYYWDENCSIFSYGTIIEKPLYTIEYFGDAITSAEMPLL